jgi:2,4-dienoyl-CoA reductase-like NADH-dependent reductase (Old Yellow Enzyme family)
MQIQANYLYLIAQFLNSATNHRKDEYGGSTVNRARFLFEITETVLEHVEPGRVGIKIGPMNIPRFNTRLQATRWKQDQFIEDLGAFRRQC